MMERKKTSSKLPKKRNGEKLDRIRSKLKFFSKETMRSLSIPRSLSSSRVKNGRKSEKSLHKSNSSSPNNSLGSVSPDRHRYFSRMTKSTISDSSYERIELNSIHNSNSMNFSFHNFAKRSTDEKIMYCDTCNEEIIPCGSITVCLYCQIVCHDKCCNITKLQCNRVPIPSISNLQITPDSENEIPKPAEPTPVRLRRKIFNSDPSPDDSEYYTCKSTINCQKTPVSKPPYNLFFGGIETINCRDSLISVTSISSISSLSSQISYDFTTHDRNSIKAYGIEVNSVAQRGIAHIEYSFSDSISDSDLSSSENNSSLTKSSDSIGNICKPSFVYNENLQNIVKIDWSISDLQKKALIFNQNNVGLSAEMKFKNGECFLLGTVRVFINLLRPIQMAFSSRPSSIFDVIGYKENDHENEFNDPEAKIETLWLPKGTSKRLFVNQSLTSREVINGLLKKFHIKANSKKFGLYEHTIEGERKVSVRKLSDMECPLGTHLLWTDLGADKMNETMTVKRLVLQENETGDIEWTGFSKPELENFLRILKREEEENSNKIKLKYTILRAEIARLMNLSDKRNDIIDV